MTADDPNRHATGHATRDAIAPRAPAICALIPTYDNPHTITAVVDQIRFHIPHILIIDDGSHAPAREVLARLAATPGVEVHTRDRNGGKGAAVKTGLRLARERGFSHAFQIDADGQHDLTRVPAFLALTRAHPDALVLARPVFDATAPKSRLRARQITCWWTRVETRGPVIDDPMCGFRVYPVEPACAVRCVADRMGFDIEIAVRLAWAGVPVLNAPVPVRYLTADEGGVSHFRLWGDNVEISRCHARLFFGSLAHRLLRRPRPRRLAPALTAPEAS